MTQPRNSWTKGAQPAPHPVVVLRDDLMQALAAAGQLRPILAVATELRRGDGDRP